jgi:hypothetical protein
MTNDNDDEIYPICEDKKVSVMLECYVKINIKCSIFLGENCIHTWVLNKRNNCQFAGQWYI